MPGQLEQRVAIVTDAASGIGRATAVARVREGARVMVADVAKTVEVEALMNDTMAAYGRIDCAVNNAGIEGALPPTAEYPEENWRRVIDVNLTSVWLRIRYEIPRMLKNGGSIVNMSSILGTVGFANAPSYTAAKHGVLGLTKAAALEYATEGIRVNAVCPAFIETPMVMSGGVQADQHPEVRQQLEHLHPMRRLGQPEEVAQAVLWLCSDASAFVTGHRPLVDGSYVSQ